MRQVLAEIARTLLFTISSKDQIALLRIVYREALQFPEAATLFAERRPNRETSALSEYLSIQSQQGDLSLEDSFLAAQQFCGMVVGDLVHRALLGLMNPELQRLLKHKS